MSFIERDGYIYTIRQAAFADGAVSFPTTKKDVEEYAKEKVLEALERVQHVREHKPENEWSSFGLSADMWDEIDDIRKELA